MILILFYCDIVFIETECSCYFKLMQKISSNSVTISVYFHSRISTNYIILNIFKGLHEKLYQCISILVFYEYFLEGLYEKNAQCIYQHISMPDLPFYQRSTQFSLMLLVEMTISPNQMTNIWVTATKLPSNDKAFV